MMQLESLDRLIERVVGFAVRPRGLNCDGFDAYGCSEAIRETRRDSDPTEEGESEIEGDEDEGASEE